MFFKNILEGLQVATRKKLKLNLSIIVNSVPTYTALIPTNDYFPFANQVAIVARLVKRTNFGSEMYTTRAVVFTSYVYPF